MVVRCEHDSVLAPGTYINVKALNEWESKVRMIDSPNGVGENVVGGRILWGTFLPVPPLKRGV